MDKNQLIEDLARAVEAAKPVQEYCFLGCQHWSTCMTKAEWSGWMQAIFSVLAIWAAVRLATRQRRQVITDNHDAHVSSLRACLQAVLDASSAMRDVERKISGESSRSPSSSRARFESLERTFQVLLAKNMPEDAVKPLLIVLREIAYTRRAIQESEYSRGKIQQNRSDKAASRTKVVTLVAQSLRRELNNKISERSGIIKKWRSSDIVKESGLENLR